MADDWMDDRGWDDDDSSDHWVYLDLFSEPAAPEDMQGLEDTLEDE